MNIVDSQGVSIEHGTAMSISKNYSKQISGTTLLLFPAIAIPVEF